MDSEKPEAAPSSAKPFSSYAQAGLSLAEAAKRLQQYGPNEIPEKKVHPLRKFMSYFWGPIPLMIEFAAALSIAIQHWDDFAIIFTLLIVNAVVGFWQEHKADNAIEMLKKRLAPKARVLREGKWQEIPARELVLGDIVRVRLGDVVPADVKLMKGEYLLADESALTGESLPVEKHVSEIAYAGSIVRQGEMDASVVATGLNSFFGKTTRLVAEAKTGSHFQKANLLELLQFALVLIVAAIPVALPAVLTVTMAIGAIALAKKEAIVSKLVSIEEMAGVDVLCSDKTGTITKNELTVAEAQVFGDFTIDDVLQFGALASREEDRDPIDDAIIAKAKSIKAVTDAASKYAAVDFKPFDPVSKRTEATVDSASTGQFKVSKGAPQVILSLMQGKDDLEDRINRIVDAFASKGYRALGVAKTDKSGKWQYAGLLAIYDPPRDDSAETIKTAQKMGVNVKMVTGDHIAVAKEISREVNLHQHIACIRFLG
jgi:H+-transporting ATPase